MKALSPIALTVRLGLVVIAAVAVSCGSTATHPTAQSTGSPVASGVLDVKAPLVGGSELDAASFAGKPVAFWFWAPT